PRRQAHRLRRLRQNGPHLAGGARTSFREERNMITWLPRCCGLLVLVLLLAAAPPPRPWAAEVTSRTGPRGSDRRAGCEAAGAALSPGGKRVLSGSCDKTVRLWDVKAGKELRKMTGHSDRVYRVAFGPEGQAISGGKDRTMRLWDLNTGKNAGVFIGHTDALV